MRSILLSFERHAGRVAAVALLGTSLVAACNEDRAVEPTAPIPAPSAPSASRLVTTGTLAWKVVDINTQALLGGTKFEVTSAQKAKWTIADNGAGDADPIVGQFKLAGLPAGTYQACETRAPAGYGLPFLNCITNTVSVGATTNLTFINAPLPTLTTEYVDYGKNLIGGGTYTIKDTLGATLETVADNNSRDGDKTDGEFKITLPYAGKFSLCETTPPPGYVFPTGQVNLCTTVTLSLNSSAHVGPFMVNPPFSVTWSVIDGFYGPNNTPGWVGPSSFTVTKDDGSFSANVVDNAANDMHLMLGIFHVKLPSAGTYNVCQVTAVPGHYMANPACHTVTVVMGTVAWGDYFIDGLQQVLNP